MGSGGRVGNVCRDLSSESSIAVGVFRTGSGNAVEKKLMEANVKVPSKWERGLPKSHALPRLWTFWWIVRYPRVLAHCCLANLKPMSMQTRMRALPLHVVELDSDVRL